MNIKKDENDPSRVNSAPANEPKASAVIACADESTRLNIALAKFEKPSEQFPLNGIEPACIKFLESFCAYMRIPVDMAVAYMLPTVSIMVGKRAYVSTEEFPCNFLSVWSSAIAPSASNKSYALRAMMQPVLTLNKEMQKDNKIRWEKECQCAQEEKRNEPSYSNFVNKKLILDDNTQEVRVKALMDNGGVVLQYAPELVDFLSALGRYSNRKDDLAPFTTLNKIFDGEDITVDRIGRPSLFVPEPHLPIAGCIQPTQLPMLCNKVLYEIGHSSRWFLAYPDQDKFEFYDGSKRPKVPQDVMYQWSNGLMNIYQNPTSRALVMDKQAENVWRKNWLAVSAEKKRRCKDDVIRSIIGKCDYYVVRLSGLIHLINEIFGQEISDVITEKEVSLSIDWVKTSYHSHLKVLSTTGLGEESQCDSVLRLLRVFKDVNVNKLASVLNIKAATIRQWRHRLLSSKS